MAKITLISIFFILFHNFVYAQKDSIIYMFPENVSGFVSDAIKKINIKEVSIQISEKSTGIYSLYFYTPKNNQDIIWKKIILKSNRFVKIHNIFIPLFFESDLNFSDFGQREVNGKIYRKKITWISENEIIKFDKFGKIYD